MDEIEEMLACEIKKGEEGTSFQVSSTSQPEEGAVSTRRE